MARSQPACPKRRPSVGWVMIVFLIASSLVYQSLMFHSVFSSLKARYILNETTQPSTDSTVESQMKTSPEMSMDARTFHRVHEAAATEYPLVEESHEIVADEQSSRDRNTTETVVDGEQSEVEESHEIGLRDRNTTETVLDGEQSEVKESQEIVADEQSSRDRNTTETVLDREQSEVEESQEIVADEQSSRDRNTTETVVDKERSVEAVAEEILPDPSTMNTQETNPEETVALEQSEGGSNNASNDFHHQSLAMLDLLDWEIQSVDGIQHENATDNEGCQPPDGIMPFCCLGCHSRGGDVATFKRSSCGGRSLDDYHVVRDHSLQILDSSSHLLSKEQSCDVCHIIELARQYNLTIGMFGDSMSNQVIHGLICEMQRRNYTVTVEHVASEDMHCYTCIKWMKHLYIRSPLWNDSDSSVHMKFMLQYMYPFTNSTEEHYVATTSDVLVVNFGLHWGYPAQQKYRDNMEGFFRYLKANGTVQLLAYRETSAQHFDADGGDYWLKTENSTNLCVPLSWRGTTGWREDYIRESAEKQGYDVVTSDHTMALQNLKNSSREKLFVLPFFNFTAIFDRMHPQGKDEDADCSHFCSSPYLYLPIWRSLRLAMDQRFGPDVP